MVIFFLQELWIWKHSVCFPTAFSQQTRHVGFPWEVSLCWLNSLEHCCNLTVAFWEFRYTSELQGKRQKEFTWYLLWVLHVSEVINSKFESISLFKEEIRVLATFILPPRTVLPHCRISLNIWWVNNCITLR